MYFLVYGILLLAPTCNCKRQDVVLTATSDCYNVNDNMTLEAEYKGSTTIRSVIWTVTGGSSSMIIIVPACSPFAIPSGFPYGRMSHDCSFATKYRLTIQTLDSADFNKTWGVDFSLLTGSTASERQQQTVTQCETVNESSTGFPRWAIGLIVLVIGVVAVIIYGVYRQQQCLKDCVKKCKCNKDDFAKEFDEKNPNEEISNCDPPDKPTTHLTLLEANGANNEDSRHESDNDCVKKFKCNKGDYVNEVNEEQHNEENSNEDSAKEFDEENYNEEISNCDLRDGERMPFTNEANKDIGQEIGSNQLDEGR